MKAMKLSSRARRRDRFTRQSRSSLNLVSLMDIFTILVFFLLVSSSNQQLSNSKDVKLPTSVATKVPRETLILTITDKLIMVQGKKVADIGKVLASEDDLIPALEKELKYQASKKRLIATDGQAGQGRAITIMGDENIPYALLRKVLATCRQANYTQIAFAATQKARGKA